MGSLQAGSVAVGSLLVDNSADVLEGKWWETR